MVSLVIRCYFIVLYFLIVVNAEISKYINCPISNNQLKYPILPGMGWDNLDNREMGKVLDLKFSKCKFSDDNKYLLPDQVSLYPKRSSHVELNSESFDHFMNYSSTTSRSMKIDGEIPMIVNILSGHFSDEYEKVKSYQLVTKSKVFRVQWRHIFYISISEPDTPLHPNFMYRITELAQWIKRYNETFYSLYLSDMIIRDFGTHVIRSIDAGAVLSKVDFLSSAFVRQMNSNEINIGASAAISFLKYFKLEMNINMKSTEEQINEYNKSCVKTIVKSYGGIPIGMDMNLDKWVASLDDKFVAIDKTGDPIYYILNKKVLPHLSNDIIHRVSNLLMKSVERYYNANSRKGCLDMNSPNFNSDANIDSGTCIEPVVYFNFGGVYSTCTGPTDQCASIERLNPLTGSNSCPDGFAALLLNEDTNECRHYCKPYWIFWEDCSSIQCSYFKLYWCYPLTYSPNHNGYRFGGFIDSQMPTCPTGFIPIKFTDYTVMCVTNDASTKNPNAIGFGGFYSCKAGNPLTESSFKDNKNNSEKSHITSKDKWLHDCPDGYVAHIATMDRNCQISYCTESNKVTLGKTPDLRKPPFFKVSFTSNGTSSKILYNKNGEMFIVNFNLNSFSKLYENKMVKSNHGIIYGFSIGGTFFIIIFIIIVLIVYRNRKSKEIPGNSQLINPSYGTFTDNV